MILDILVKKAVEFRLLGILKQAHSDHLGKLENAVQVTDFTKSFPVRRCHYEDHSC